MESRISPGKKGSVQPISAVYSPERLGMIAPLPERVDGIDLLLWSIPYDLVYSWGVFALVFGYSSDSKSFAAERVGQQTLQGSHLVPSTFLSCLHNSRLKPTHVFIDLLPFNSMPVSDTVEGCTSSVFTRWFCCRASYRHLLFLLDRFVKCCCDERPGGSLPAFA